MSLSETLPQSLRSVVDDARAAVAGRPRHNLNLGYRRAIWAVFGPPMDSVTLTPTTGTKRRVALATLTARHVLPAWEGTWPDDRTPHHILDAAQGVLQGTHPREAARANRDRFWDRLEKLGHGDADIKVLSCAGYSAIATLNAALRDELFDPARIDYDVGDGAVDPYQSDAAYFAAIACAHGPVRSSSSDADKRRQFWTWWLDEAVPAAWDVAE